MMSNLRVNFGFSTIGRVTGWSDEVLVKKEGDLDFFLDQELSKRFPGVGCQGVAFYAQDLDYLVEAYDSDGNPVDGPTDEELEQVIRSAAARI